MTINGSWSEWHEILSRLSQGSVLNPGMFSDLHSRLESFLNKFGNDMKLEKTENMLEDER